MAMKKMCLRKTVCFLLVLSMIAVLAGCGGGNPTASGSGTDAGHGNGAGSGDDVTAMGRYVETEIDLTEQLINGKASHGIRRLSDGRLVILNTTAGLVVSEDEGLSWEAQRPEWMADLQSEHMYLSDMDIAPDGTVVMACVAGSGDESRDSLLQLILPDGTKVTAEAALTEEEKYFNLVSASGEGRFFAATVEGSVYEIDTDGSAKKLFTAEVMPAWMQIQNDLLFLDSGLGYGTMPALYDLGKGTYVEDTVLQEFVESTYGDRSYSRGISQTMCLLPGEEQTIYTVGGKGIHRHVIGGNMMEQVVDGSLSMLGNPNYAINSAIRLEGDAFLVLFSNGRLLRFVYDPTIASVPENTLSIYSLREDGNIRQAIAGYQSLHTDVFVSYEIGIADDSAVTREDAIKKLNTEIMAGMGPDLLVLDDLPIRSYVEKGLLFDLTGHLDAYGKQEPLFDNIIDALKIEEKAYTVPAAFSIPMIIGKKEQTASMANLSDIADIVEQMRKAEPGKDLIGMTGEREVLSHFAAVSAPAWIGADGRIDRQALREFLEQCSRIHSAQMDGLDGSAAKRYAERKIGLEALGSTNPDRDWQAVYALFDLLSGKVSLVSGWVDSGEKWIEMVSIDRALGFEEYQAAEMKGQCSNVFWPKTLLAVSTASSQTDEALAFLDYFLSAQTQSGYDGFPVNQEAFVILFTPEKGYVAKDGGCSYLSLVDENGTMMEYTGYWPADADLTAFQEQLAGLQTAYLPDTVLEEAVYEQGVAYMLGQQTLEEALDEIEKKAAIYIAE